MALATEIIKLINPRVAFYILGSSAASVLTFVILRSKLNGRDRDNLKTIFNEILKSKLFNEIKDLIIRRIKRSAEDKIYKEVEALVIDLLISLKLLAPKELKGPIEAESRIEVQAQKEVKALTLKKFETIQELDKPRIVYKRAPVIIYRPKPTPLM